jgi:2-polyprenyl-6-methoxyphenol hydroxylase-like FAD-dependent oxidoreductase
MPHLKPITIVGGGVAGLTLGIGLRQRGIPVTLWEARPYPRHRVCGEFISGRGQNTLARLGLLKPMEDAGAVWAKTTMFLSVTVGRSQTRRPMPEPALCLSRFRMDDLLARKFQDSGGELREGERWDKQNIDEGLVCARGRRLAATEHGCRWFGLKVHARNVSLAADLEMHLQSDGYVGLCRLKNEIVNICGLFRRPFNTTAPAQPWQEKLRGVPGTALHARLGEAIFLGETFSSVAGLSLKPQQARDRDECCIGDALTMIPPVTGNGMSMAFESAELAIKPLAAYSHGEIDWRTSQKIIARACDRRFRRRLAWARLLQWMMFAPVFQSALGNLALGSGSLWRLMFARTR